MGYKEFDVDEMMGIVTKLPKNTVSFSIVACVLEGDKIQKYKREYEPEALRECRKDFIDLVGDDEYDIKYGLTEKGEELLKGL